MCGLSGFMLAAPQGDHPCHRLSAGGLLAHRGPDAFDRWNDAAQCVGLQHYRLAVLDLTPAGAQPMRSADGRFVVAFNGEIYNHLELRERLAREGVAVAWRGHSDTETLLAGCAAWGLRRTLERCAGMFALALFDQQRREITLARDRLGEKPMYYGLQRGALCFASELKALRAVDRSAALHTGALAAYMRLGYVPGEQSIYEGVVRLPPGRLVTIDAGHLARGRLPASQTYWSAAALPAQQRTGAAVIDDVQALDGLDTVLRRAVAGQMVADVPLGALLSGGIDSSLVVALMQAQSSQPVHTFSIGFEGSASDEAPHARQVAAHLGTRHTELYVSAADALAAVPRLSEIYCEPFADSSQVPTLLVAAIARREVTVALTGDGGDELFAGYDRYFRVRDGWRFLQPVPHPLRRLARRVLEGTPLPVLDAIARASRRAAGLRHPADRLRKIAAVLDSRDPSQLNRGLVTLWDPWQLMPGHREVESVFSRDLPGAPSGLEQLMLADTLCYLPDDLLVKVDRAAMAVSLETRAPFLDHRVVEYAWSLPLERKVHAGQGKWLLRRLLDRYVPHELVNRPKQGFGLPVDGWLQGPLRDWAESLLSPQALSRHGLFDVALVRRRWQEHLSGTRHWQQHLWCMLMFQAWAQRQP